MNGLYRVLEKVKEVLEADIDVNTVTYGDITQVDLEKQTIYPLSHVMLNTVVSNEQVLRFNISIIAMDIVDVTKEEDDGYERSNEQDVLNTQLAVLNKAIQKMRIGNLYRDKYQIEGDVSIEPFTDRFENQVAGVVGTFDIIIENDVDVC
jgi:hypothetical protein|tara:strand:+ start:1024 stop:1473 length:450 start_codon:yes stop_codon:yes gene_type:complete